MVLNFIVDLLSCVLKRSSIIKNGIKVTKSLFIIFDGLEWFLSHHLEYSEQLKLHYHSTFKKCWDFKILVRLLNSMNSFHEYVLHRRTSDMYIVSYTWLSKQIKKVMRRKFFEVAVGWLSVHRRRLTTNRFTFCVGLKLSNTYSTSSTLNLARQKKIISLTC